MSKFREFMEKHSKPIPIKAQTNPIFLDYYYLKKVVEGITNFDIVDGDDEPDKTVSVGFLFKSINSFKNVKNITDSDIDKFYSMIIANNKFNDSIDINKVKTEFQESKSTWNNAVKILKLFRKDYFTSVILPISNKRVKKE